MTLWQKLDISERIAAVQTTAASKNIEDWKTRARVTPRAEEALTPDNFYN